MLEVLWRDPLREMLFQVEVCLVESSTSLGATQSSVVVGDFGWVLDGSALQCGLLCWRWDAFDGFDFCR